MLSKSLTRLHFLSGQMLALLAVLGTASTERASPAFWLNNWDRDQPLLAFWGAASDSWTVAPSHRPGMQNVRAFSDLTRDIFTDDSFALEVDGEKFTDPMQLNSSHLGGCVFETDGELWTEYTHYGTKQMPITVRRSFYLPPGELFYEVRYRLTSPSGTKRVRLLDFLISGPCNEWALGNCNGNVCVIDQRQCLGLTVAVSVDQSHTVASTMGNGDFNNNDNPLKSFATSSQIPNFPEYNQFKVAFGALYDIEVGTTPVDIVTFRAVGQNADSARNNLNKALGKKPAEWESATAKSITDWLKSGELPSLTGDHEDMYKKSLLVLKNSQNPQRGTIASSLHPLYGYKNWMRDSIMAAFMLDAAGHHDEAQKFFDWIPYAPLTDTGAWHTCYDTFTGDTVGFVEPQYDSVGLYLIAMNYHLSCYGDSAWVKSHLSTIERAADWLVSRKGQNNLAPSDRAPWEESTDHHTGKDIPEQYYTWTQGCSYGGLVAASLIEKAVGSTERSNKYATRANELKEAVMSNLWDDDRGCFFRGRTSDTFAPDTRAESSSLSVIFTGLVDKAKGAMHLNYIVKNLEHLGGGIARYSQDPYFFDSIWNPCGRGTYETQRDEPSWPVTTAYACWSEHALGIDYQKRLDWMVKYSAFMNMPTGEAVDSQDGALVVPSCPDGFEHGGVFVYTTLLKHGQAKSILDTLQ